MPPIQLKRICTAISFDIKREYMVTNPNVNQGGVASFFNKKYQKLNIDRMTINKIWKSCEKWLSVLSTSQTSHIFRHHSVQFSELDKAMQIWTS
jgi:hypothetical protein